MYDVLVLGLSNRFAWRCPSGAMLERYDRHVGRRYVDLGVGTGWFLDRCRWPVERPEITLLDLNENSLSMAAQTSAAVRAADGAGERARSASARGRSFRLRRSQLPAPLPTRTDRVKAATLAKNVCPYLAPGGVFFGSTILGRSVPQGRIGRRLMNATTGRGSSRTPTTTRTGWSEAWHPARGRRDRGGGHRRALRRDGLTREPEERPPYRRNP